MFHLCSTQAAPAKLQMKVNVKLLSMLSNTAPPVKCVCTSMLCRICFVLVSPA